MTNQQGEVREIGLGSESGWHLKIRRDGSAQISRANWSESAAETPRGIFDFTSARDELLEASRGAKEGASGWFVYFLRLGQTSCSSHGIAKSMAKAFFRKAIQAGRE